MSKLVITGIENGNISYVEGEEVVTSVINLSEKAKTLREAITEAKSITLEMVEEAHSQNLFGIQSAYEAKINEAETERLQAIEEENSRYESAKAAIISPEKIAEMEIEESKISALLDSLKVKEDNSEPLFEKEEALVEEEVEVNTPAETIKEVEPELSSEPKVEGPKKIIF